MNNESVVFIQKEVYGKTLYYPASDNACIFAALVNQKTLTAKQLLLIESLGFTLSYKLMPVELV